MTTRKHGAGRFIPSKARSNHIIRKALEQTFFETISDGPVHGCVCCGQLWLKDELVPMKRKKVQKHLPKDYARVYPEKVQECAGYCKSCYADITRGTVPLLASCYGFRYPEQPDYMAHLTHLDTRLVAGRIPFLQIKDVGSAEGYAGSIINVPMPMKQTTPGLPREPKDSFTIPVVRRPWQDLKVVDWDFQASGEPPPSEEEEELFTDTVVNPTEMLLASGDPENPFPMFMLKYGDELSFPKIYCGEMRHITRRTRASLLEIYQSEIRRVDRRGAIPDKVLFNYFRLAYRQTRTFLAIVHPKKAACRGETPGGTYLPYLDLAFQFMKSIPGSLPYWVDQRSRVAGHLRQWGLPTLFLTVTAAETQWYDLINQLVYLHLDSFVTREEFQAMTTLQKALLVRSDPVYCALYFHHKMKALMEVLEHAQGPLGRYKLLHYYQRVEFLPRGSPQYHLSLYLKKAPVYNGHNEEAVVAFVDSLFTCSMDHPQAPLQHHRHTAACQKACPLPFFPMDQTRILVPIQEGERHFNKAKYDEIRHYLSTLAESPHPRHHPSFEHFLQDLDVGLDTYLYAIRSGIQCSTLMLKRHVSEILIQPYNATVLKLMQSTQKLQFVLGKGDVVSYLADFVRNPSAGLSQLMKECIEATKKGTLPLEDTMKNFFLNGREVSVQEATWLLLGFPLSQWSKDITHFTPSIPPEERALVTNSEALLKTVDLMCKFL